MPVNPSAPSYLSAMNALGGGLGDQLSEQVSEEEKLRRKKYLADQAGQQSGMGSAAMNMLGMFRV